jgi:hypothetical protein
MLNHPGLNAWLRARKPSIPPLWRHPSRDAFASFGSQRIGRIRQDAMPGYPKTAPAMPKFEKPLSFRGAFCYGYALIR